MAPFEGVAREGEGVDGGVDGDGFAGGGGGHGVCALVKGRHCAGCATVGTAGGSGWR